MRLLLIEDDLKLASYVVKGLKESGFAVDHVGDGEEGLYQASVEPYDLVIVDIMLPKKDGFSLIEDLRKVKPKIPILILSAKRSLEEKVKGFHKGSDDYLTKPFAFAELLVRIQALIRRASVPPNTQTMKIGDLILNCATYEISRAGQQIELKPKEFSILEYLMRHQGEVVTRTMLLEHVWDIQFDPLTNVVDVHICRLREKIDKNFEQKLLHTIRGVGYVIKET